MKLPAVGLASGLYHAVIGSHILGKGALKTSVQYRLRKWGIAKFSDFAK
ncbi:MAG: hypothetical protein JW761_03330 [Prolixibacteraceae bacterium]|nr:hypothetical protein [Prolixibacteraceae bacterium]